MPKLYGCTRSRASRPVWLLHEIGLTVEQVPVIQAYRLSDPGAAEAPLNTSSPAFRAINPMGQIPAWVEDGLLLTESLAICLHIARSHGGPLGPQTPTEAAQAENWALFGATALEPDGIAILETYRDGLAETDAGRATIAAATGRLTRPLRTLETLLSAQDWLIAGRFTVADLMVAECLRYGTTHAPLLAPYPATTAWLARCHDRPAFKAMWAKRSAEPA